MKSIDANVVYAAVQLYNEAVKLLTEDGWQPDDDDSPAGYHWRHPKEPGCFSVGAAIRRCWQRRDAKPKKVRATKAAK